MNNIFKLSLISGLVSFFCVSCSQHAANHPSMANDNQHANHTQGSEVVMNSLDPNAKFKVDFKANPTTIETGKQTELVFTVKDSSGATVKDLQIVHEKPMHLLIVSDDLAFFDHIHPLPQSDGTLKVPFTFPEGGNYKLYVDYTPKDEHQLIDRIDLKVSGKERVKQALIEDVAPSKTVESLKVVMASSKTLRAGDELMLNFTVTDAKTDKPVKDLEKYLGEYAHFVVISEDTTQFLHVHPMANSKGSESTTVMAHTKFPKAGLYKLWAQFQRGGKVITVPFVVNVVEGDKAQTETKKASEPTTDMKTIKVTVSSDGYEPSQINVEKGKKVMLAFYRKDAENCGDELVFPSLGIKKKLPVGKTVVVEITPKESGDINFACGMNMMKGKLIVQ